MYGAIIGDIIGSIYEGVCFKSKDFELWGENCRFTDDSVMSVAVMDALITSKEEQIEFKNLITDKLKYWGRKYPLRGYGGTFIKWLQSENTEPYNSFGNGSAMRVSACGFLANSLMEASKYAKESAMVTHNHPEGMKGAEAIANAIFLARCGKQKAEIKEFLQKFYLLDKSLDDIRLTYSFDVTCQGTVPQAIQCFLESDSFEDSIRNAISLGGDADTLAAITGSIAEAYYGIPTDIKNKMYEYLTDDIKVLLQHYEDYKSNNNEDMKLYRCESILGNNAYVVQCSIDKYKKYFSSLIEQNQYKTSRDKIYPYNGYFYLIVGIDKSFASLAMPSIFFGNQFNGNFPKMEYVCDIKQTEEILNQIYTFIPSNEILEYLRKNANTANIVLDNSIKTNVPVLKRADNKSSIYNLTHNKDDELVLMDVVTGCLYGGAIGDAWGYPVEFMKLYQIKDLYGENGITELEFNNGKALISDDTQMTLFTANGLLYGQTRGALRGISGSYTDYVFMAYKEWRETQINPHILADNKICWIHNIDELHSMRAPGNTCMSAIATSSGKGNTENPINDSKGCGGVMRVAPVGCFAYCHFNEQKAVVEAAEIAALTHGHPLGYIPAAYLSLMIYYIIENKFNENAVTLFELANKTLEKIKEMYANKAHIDDFIEIMHKAIQLSQNSANDIVAIEELGEGWIAEEALAIALYSALKYNNEFKKCIICSVNHDGDSDSTGSIAGNILGAYLGMHNIEMEFYTKDGIQIHNIEARDVIYELANDIVNGCKMYENCIGYDAKWMAKYVYCNYGKK